MKKDDIAFLKELQGRIKNEHEYLTGPVFWSIGESVRKKEPRLFRPEGTIVFETEEGQEFKDIKEFYESIKEWIEYYPEVKVYLEDDEIKFEIKETYGINKFSINFDDWIENIQYALDEINKFMGSCNYDCCEYENVEKYRGNLFFFTKEEAERCLEANKKYLQEPFIYQTATPNPEMKKLWRIIKETDWSKLEVAEDRDR